MYKREQTSNISWNLEARQCLNVSLSWAFWRKSLNAGGEEENTLGVMLAHSISADAGDWQHGLYILCWGECVCVCVCVCVCARAHVRTLVPMALIMTSFLSLLEKRKNTYFESSKETFETHHLINKWVNRGQRNRVTRLRSHSWLEPGQEHKAGLQSSSWRVCASLKYRWTPTNTSLCTWVQGIWSKWA